MFKSILSRAFFSIASTWSAFVLSKGCIPMKSLCITKKSSTNRMQVTSCSLLETSAISSPMIVKNVALWIFAASCQGPLPLAAHSESLVMCVSHLFSEATQWSLDFLEPLDSATDENWSSRKTLFQCSSFLLMAKPVALSLDNGQDWEQNLSTLALF